MLQVFRKLCSDATFALEVFDADVTNFRGAVAVGYLCFHHVDFHPNSREWVRFASPHGAVAAGFSHFLHRRDFRSRDACAFIEQIFIQILVCGNFSSLCMWRLLEVFRKLRAVAIAALMLFSFLCLRRRRVFRGRHALCVAGRSQALHCCDYCTRDFRR
jgi:hypothetical protein